MLMSVIEGALSVPAYPELAGKRVLITGLTSRCGVDIVRAFAEHRGRLVMQFAEASETMETVAEIAAPDALEAKAYGPVGCGTEAAVQFAKTAMRAFGGLDVVINLVALDPHDLDASATLADVEQMVADRLTLPHQISRIAANRMSMVWTEGLILNIATLGGSVGRRGRAFAAVAKAGLTALTRAQAEEWAGRAVRFNAIAPESGLASGGQGLSGEPDIAAMALYLASGRGKALSGCVFEAAVA
ncbi:MAG: SDR family oxidoreductase [Hyphomonadaceae bacterium]|nr:SDR family oxidoreductase [Hyphomonadaceae bacterium]